MADGTIFLSYARTQAHDVEEISVKLRAKGHSVFFDCTSLRGETFDARIQDEVLRCSLFVFFVCEDSLKADSYARTELGYAEARWPNPDGQVLAIRADHVTVREAPAYLRALTTIQPIIETSQPGRLTSSSPLLRR